MRYRCYIEDLGGFPQAKRVGGHAVICCDDLVVMDNDPMIGLLGIDDEARCVFDVLLGNVSLARELDMTPALQVVVYDRQEDTISYFQPFQLDLARCA